MTIAACTFSHHLKIKGIQSIHLPTKAHLPIKQTHTLDFINYNIYILDIYYSGRHVVASQVKKEYLDHKHHCEQRSLLLKYIRAT
jgi:hypothetical protein